MNFKKNFTAIILSLLLGVVGLTAAHAIEGGDPLVEKFEAFNSQAGDPYNFDGAYIVDATKPKWLCKCLDKNKTVLTVNSKTESPSQVDTSRKACKGDNGTAGTWDCKKP
jgi:hypothetical protein